MPQIALSVAVQRILGQSRTQREESPYGRLIHEYRWPGLLLAVRHYSPSQIGRRRRRYAPSRCVMVVESIRQAAVADPGMVLLSQDGDRLYGVSPMAFCVIDTTTPCGSHIRCHMALIRGYASRLT